MTYAKYLNQKKKICTVFWENLGISAYHLPHDLYWQVREVPLILWGPRLPHHKVCPGGYTEAIFSRK